MLRPTLEKIYDYSSDRLKYAESKNGALLAVTSLILFRMMDAKLVITPSLKPIYFSGLLFFSIAILICISSFVAHLNVPKMMKKGKTTLPKKYGDFNNLLSSLRVAHYHPENFAKQVLGKLQQNDYKITPLDIDYAEHIIVNSKVALHKFRCFHTATICMLVGMICAITVKISGLI